MPNNNRPSYIVPVTSPLQASIQLQNELKDGIRKLIDIQAQLKKEDSNGELRNS